MRNSQLLRRRFRPAVDDRLEARITPSVTAAAVVQHGTGDGQASPSSTTPIVALIQQNYANFATNVRNLEATLAGPGGASLSSVSSQVAQQVQDLAQQVGSELGPLPQVAALARQQIGGSSAFGLRGAVNAVFAAQAGQPGTAGLASLIRGVDALMASSYATTASDLYLAEVGGLGASGSNAAGGRLASGVLQAVPTIQQDYSSFATNVRKLEGSLSGSGAASISSQVGQQVQTLAQQVAAAIGQQGVPQVAALARQQIGGSSGYGLLGAMNSLFAAQGNASGTAGLATLMQAVEGLMANSYATTASDLDLADIGGIGLATTAAGGVTTATRASQVGPGTQLGLITGPTVGSSTGTSLTPLGNGTGGTALAVGSAIGTGTGSIAYQTGAGTDIGKGPTTYPGHGEATSLGAGGGVNGFGENPGPSTVPIVTGTGNVLGTPPGLAGTGATSQFVGPANSFGSAPAGTNPATGTFIGPITTTTGTTTLGTGAVGPGSSSTYLGAGTVVGPVGGVAS